MGINIEDLQPLGGSLLSGSESIMGNLRVLSEDELSLSGGGEDDDDSFFIIVSNNNNNSNNGNNNNSSYFYSAYFQY
ncbi:MAG: hypothetical protein RLZZ574_1372 [Cyanobacteriota bacterium]|jgi:hypothetical protein